MQCRVVWQNIPTLGKNVLSPSSQLNSRSWRWKEFLPPKRQLISTRHGITPQRTKFTRWFILLTRRTLFQKPNAQENLDQKGMTCPQPLWTLQRRRRKVYALGIEPRLSGSPACNQSLYRLLWEGFDQTRDICWHDERLLASQGRLCPMKLRTSATTSSLISASRPSHLRFAK